MGSRILITNFELGSPTGTTLYVRDLALELKRKGYEPSVYARHLGAIARDISDAGIEITRNLRRVRRPPDLIHGHHVIPTLDALRRFPAVPAISICHDHTAFVDGAVRHPQIRRYLGVSQLCIERLIREGVAPDKIRLLPNFVDTRRFVPRGDLPDRPRRAVVFSNYAHAGTHLPAVAEACREAGLMLDVIGKSAGRFVARPELALPSYDIVFAKGKAALEAMASGAAVILCDYGGVGPLVTLRNFDPLRVMNFGFQALAEPLTAAAVAHQIERYDPYDAARVCERVRTVASLEHAVYHLCEIYREVIHEAAGDGVARNWGGTEPAVGADAGVDASANPRNSLRAAALLLWLELPDSAKILLRRLPGMRGLSSRIWRSAR